MTTSVVGWVALGALAICVVGFALLHVCFNRAAGAELVSRPKELGGARLLYLEKRFQVHQPIGLVARLDRAYLGRDGVIVLVELKTRWTDRTYATDVIQLSAQRMALEGQTAHKVASHAFVTVERPMKTVVRRSHRVELLESSEVVAIYRRRQDILAGRVAPKYVGSPIACRGCGFREHCDRPGE